MYNWIRYKIGKDIEIRIENDQQFCTSIWIVLDIISYVVIQLWERNEMLWLCHTQQEKFVIQLLCGYIVMYITS